MFGFAVELILILITLLAAVAGTVGNPSRPLKMGIIGLAVLTSVGSVVTFLDAERRAERNARSITALVQAIDPPEYFAHDLVAAVNPLLDGSGQYVSGQTVMADTGERTLILSDTGSTEALAGVIFFSRKKMVPIYYAYAVDEDLSVPLRAHMSSRWTDCHDHWNECLVELRGISREAWDLAPIVVESATANLTTDLTFTLTSDETWRGVPLTITLLPELVSSLQGLDPAVRGLRILEAAQASLVDQL
ncbi:MAG: hypothetical protein AB8B85_15705 [Paracoccaceae bacterium]